MRYFWYICFCLCSFCGSAFSKESAYTATQAELLTSSQTAVLGEKLWIMIKITPQNGWHIYWNNPGDVGLPTTAELSSDLGTVLLKRQSSPKHFFIQNLITQYAYDNDAYWLFELSLPKQTNESLEAISLNADISWLACKEECVAENMTISKAIPFADKIQPTPSWKKEFKAAQKTFPHSYQKGYFKVKQNTLYVKIPHFTQPLASLKFIPFIRDTVDHQHPIRFSLRLDGNLQIIIPLKENIILPSVFKALALTDQGVWQFRLTKNDFSLQTSQMPSVLMILLMAFCGGLILNLMPCIFPILFIKAIQLMNTSQRIGQKYKEAMFYFSGVVFSFALIAGLLWIFRLGGEAIGWGFQLQSPIFIAVLFILFFIVGLMFLGIIQINFSFFNKLGTFSLKNTSLNAFLTGLVAVLIASPCSAPFMGTAIAYSLTQPLYIYFPVFIALAVGYALPFSLLMIFPQAISTLLPKPGKWMEDVKKICALPIFLTCLWLGWIFYNQTHTSISDDVISSGTEWQIFSKEKLQTLQAQNEPVFIDFTAKWCLTCLVNEKTALSSRPFKKIVQEKRIHLLKADWTTKDETVTQALAVYNRNSVPLYVYYDGKNQHPIILPQLLTTKIIKQYLH